jgi:pyruvate kinase
MSAGTGANRAQPCCNAGASQVHAGVRILMDDGEIELCVMQTNPP